jgi:hypothetical protein
MIQVLLTMEQATLVSTAIQAEIRKGNHTFLTYDDVEALGVVKTAIDSQVESRLLAVEAAG